MFFAYQRVGPHQLKRVQTKTKNTSRARAVFCAYIRYRGWERRKLEIENPNRAYCISDAYV